jgi:hypothetical protein
VQKYLPWLRSIGSGVRLTRITLAMVCLSLGNSVSAAVVKNLAPSENPLLGVAADLLGSDDRIVAHQGPMSEINDGIVSQNLAPDAFLINADGQNGSLGNGADTFAPEFGNYAYDFAGVLFDSPQFGVTSVRVQNYLANDGGWWGPTQTTNGGAALGFADLVSPQVQVTFDGGASWTNVPFVTSNYRTQYNGAIRGTEFPNATSGPLATMTFQEQNGINGIRLIGEGAGPADGTGFIGVTEFEVYGVAAELMLEVNTVSGRVRLVNDSLSAIAFDLYRINSPSGSLNMSAGSWNSLDIPSLNPDGFPAGTGAGDGWERMANLSNKIVAESYLQGASTLLPGEFVSLGELYSGGTSDLSLRYRMEDGTFIDIGATYIASPDLAADFNDDDVVDALDLDIWQNSFGVNGDADANGDGVSDGRDFLIWQRDIGSGTPLAVQAIPEPSAGLLSISLLGLQGALRRSLSVL